MPKTNALPQRRRPLPPGSPTPEDRFLAYGGARPPGLQLANASSHIGGNARAAVQLLLEQIEVDGPMATIARNILASCAQPQEVPLHWPDLMGLQHTYWLAVSELLSFIRRAGPLSTADFEDQGERFRRLVLGPAREPKRANVGARQRSRGFVG